MLSHFKFVKFPIIFDFRVPKDNFLMLPLLLSPRCYQNTFQIGYKSQIYGHHHSSEQVAVV